MRLTHTLCTYAIGFGIIRVLCLCVLFFGAPSVQGCVRAICLECKESRVPCGSVVAATAVVVQWHHSLGRSPIPFKWRCAMYALCYTFIFKCVRVAVCISSCRVYLMRWLLCCDNTKDTTKHSSSAKLYTASSRHQTCVVSSLCVRLCGVDWECEWDARRVRCLCIHINIHIIIIIIILYIWHSSHTFTISNRIFTKRRHTTPSRPGPGFCASSSSHHYMRTTNGDDVVRTGAHTNRYRHTHTQSAEGSSKQRPAQDQKKYKHQHRTRREKKIQTKQPHWRTTVEAKACVSRAADEDVRHCTACFVFIAAYLRPPLGAKGGDGCVLYNRVLRRVEGLLLPLHRHRTTLQTWRLCGACRDLCCSRWRCSIWT